MTSYVLGKSPDDSHDKLRVKVDYEKIDHWGLETGLGIRGEGKGGQNRSNKAHEALNSL